ncbi:hypothetical protein V1477_013660 [Vespula maculifrons]|uniref:Uncharacterized protein n=1 Tax=Vespula maculifrons TaxID=7453 RepID=A0ABD2BNX0_VESMC
MDERAGLGQNDDAAGGGTKREENETGYGEANSSTKSIRGKPKSFRFILESSPPKSILPPRKSPLLSKRVQDRLKNNSANRTGRRRYLYDVGHIHALRAKEEAKAAAAAAEGVGNEEGEEEVSGGQARSREWGAKMLLPESGHDRGPWTRGERRIKSRQEKGGRVRGDEKRIAICSGSNIADYHHCAGV